MNINLDYAAIGRILGEAPAVAALQSRASKTVKEAKATGPRGKHAGAHEIDKLSVGETKQGDYGAAVEIDWASHVWHLIEFGSVNNPPYRPVSRAAQANGLKVTGMR